MNRIRDLVLLDRLEDPAAAEVWLGIVPEQESSGLEVRGRLIGPRCVYATTVEVAYPLRPLPTPPAGLPGLPRRVLIPEASLWEPDCPFLYQGPIELWEAGQQGDRVWLRHGLRHVSLGRRGLRVNGRPFMVHGVARDRCTEAQARDLRQAGVNTLLAAPGADLTALCEAADRLGFFVLARGPAHPIAAPEGLCSPAPPSFLGWLVTPDTAPLPPGAAAQPRPFVGLEMTRPPAGALPEQAAFVACAEAALPALESIPLPKLLLRQGSPVTAHAAGTGPAGTIGSVWVS